MKKSRGNFGFENFSTYRNELFAFSIISIIIFHFCENFIEVENQTSIFTLPIKCYNEIISSIGVEIFILLSGFGLYFSFKKNPDIKEFYFKRFVRILVPYGIFASIAWLIIAIIGKTDFWRYIYNLSLLSFWTDGNIMLWYIALILVMYLAFPLIFIIVNSVHSGRNTLISVSVVYLILFACENIGTSAFEKIEIALWRIPVFIIGAYLGKLAFEKQKFKSWHIVLFSVFLLQKLIYSLFRAFFDIEKLDGPIYLIYDFTHKYFRFFSGFYSVGLLFLLVVILRALNSNIIAKISYPISKVTLELYMTHVTLRNIFNRLGMPVEKFWCFLVYISISIIITILLNFVSNKIINIINNRHKNSLNNSLII